MESFQSSLTPRELEKFTKRVKQALRYAAEEARALQQPQVGAEHMLLGLIEEDEGLAGHALKQLGVTLSQARQVVGSGSEGNTKASASELQVGDEVRHVFASATDAAWYFGHDYIGTEHVLLGLLRDSQGVGARTIAKLGVSREQARAEVLRLLRQTAA